MKKLLSIIFLLFITTLSYGQTVFTQTFVDRCTGEVKVVTANFVNGSATVAFYDKVRIFTFQQYTNGELQAWLIQTYEWWQALSPCSSTTQQVQQAQQTAQAAQQAAQTASAAASTAATAATSVNVPSTPSTTSTVPNTNTNTNASSGTTGTTNNTTQNNTSNNTSSNQSSSGSSESSSGQTSDTGGGGKSSEGSGGGETTGGDGGKTEETKGGGESKTEESKSEETKTEESKSEESKSEEGGDEETNSNDDGDGEESEEVKEEEKKEEKEKEKEEKKEEKKKEKEEKKKQRALTPIQLKADMMAMQNPLGGYNAAMSFGASRSSIFGDVSYGATLMVFDNLQQATLGLNKAKIYMDDSYNVDWIESIGLSYGNNFGTQSTAGNFMRLKPMGKKGTIGFGVNYTYMFGGMLEKPMGSMGYNLLYTNSFVRPDNKWSYSPAFIISQTPLSFTLDRYSNISGDAMFILANSFTYRLTKRFTVNFGYTAIKSTNPLIPLINSFMIGSKLPF